MLTLHISSLCLSVEADTRYTGRDYYFWWRGVNLHIPLSVVCMANSIETWHGASLGDKLAFVHLWSFCVTYLTI